MKQVRWLPIVALSLLLGSAGCDYRLTLRLSPAGRGRFVLKVTPDAAQPGGARLFLARCLRLAAQAPMETTSAKLLDHGRLVQIEGRFESIAALAPADLFARSRCFFGPLRDDGAALLQCTHDPFPMKKEDRITVIARLPCDVLRSNGRIDSDSRGVSWKLSGEEASTREIRLWALMP